MREMLLQTLKALGFALEKFQLQPIDVLPEQGHHENRLLSYLNFNI